MKNFKIHKSTRTLSSMNALLLVAVCILILLSNKLHDDSHNINSENTCSICIAQTNSDTGLITAEFNFNPRTAYPMAVSVEVRFIDHQQFSILRSRSPPLLS